MNLQDWMRERYPGNTSLQNNYYWNQRPFESPVRDRGGGRFTKYGWDHSHECICDQCMTIYWNHQGRSGGYCICESCKATRERASLIRATEETSRPEKGNTVANIAICDRPNCGSMIKSTAAGAFDLYTGGDSDKREEHQGQLCPACVGDFITWLEGPVTGERQKAYSKAWERPNEKTLDKLTSAQLMTLALERGREELNAE